MEIRDIEKVVKYHTQGLSPPEIKYRIKVDAMRWSFSRVNSFYDGCRYCWYRSYIDGVRGESGVFAEYGSFMHEILEKFDKGEIMPWELLTYYVDNYKDNIGEFPRMGSTDLNTSYFNQGYEYLENYTPEANWEILSVEEEVNMLVGDYTFIGYIDKLVRDRNDGKLIVIDHKSKNGFKNVAEQKKYARQLYLYSKFVYEKYGEYPKMLLFNMFRANKQVPIIFKEKDYLESQEWFINVIEDIKNCREFPVTSDKFFREQLCNCKGSPDHFEGAIMKI